MDIAPLADIIRGDTVESQHLGAVAVVNAHGDVLFQAGDSGFLTFTRSTLKPFQAAPFVRDGGPDQFRFTSQETALLCASHSGESMHVQAVQAMLDKIGCGERDLACGCHAPLYLPSDDMPADAGFNQLHNNCSGKHAGFLAYCKLHGYAIDDYINPAHPLQYAVRKSIAYFFGIEESALALGIDGCSAPNYAVPLSRLAYAYARLAHGEQTAEYGDALEKLFRAMTAHPEMVAGTGRFDSALMQAGAGDWVAKGGAEGVQAIGIRSQGLGIAIKVVDGNGRAIYPAALAILEQLGVMNATQKAMLAAWEKPQIKNLRDIPTGEVRAKLHLHQSQLI